VCESMRRWTPQSLPILKHTRNAQTPTRRPADAAPRRRGAQPTRRRADAAARRRADALPRRRGATCLAAAARGRRRRPEAGGGGRSEARAPPPFGPLRAPLAIGATTISGTFWKAVVLHEIAIQGPHYSHIVLEFSIGNTRNGRK
jgi:hypothetical protein